MNFTAFDMPQRSPEWYAKRLGLLTGSCADAVIAERKRGTGELKERVQLRRRLVCERLTGLSAEDTFETDAMRRGRDLEPLAFAAYEAHTGLMVERVGFVAHNTLQAGCSPDGFVNGWEGLIELKVPKSTTHLEYLEAGVLPDAYRGQVIHALWLTGAHWCDFCSFDDRFASELEIFIVRVPRVEVEIAAYDTTVRKFLTECDEYAASILARVTAARAAGEQIGKSEVSA